MTIISASVGASGRNLSGDVRLIQRLLIRAGINSGPVDGICGTKTKGGITEYQRRFLPRPDGRVDPGGQTLWRLDAELAKQISPGAPTPIAGGALPPSLARHRAQIERAALQVGAPASQVNEFLAFWEQSQFPTLKNILNAIGTADEAFKVAAFFFFLRKFGFSLVDVAKVMVVVAALKAPHAFALMAFVVQNGARVRGALSKAGGLTTALAIFITVIELYNLVADGEYAQATAALYKSAMGVAVPWTAVIDLVQAMLPRQDVKSTNWLKVLKACDPVGLGGAAADTFGFAVYALVDKLRGRQFNESRLAQLSDRMKKGPTALFAAWGENMGDYIYDILQMNADDWKLVGQYTKDEFNAWIKGF